MRHTFLKGAAVYTLSSAFTASMPFLLMPALTRVMQPAEYGVVAMFATLVTVTSALVGLSAHGSVSVKFFDKSSDDFDCYVTSCMAVMVGSFFVVLLGMLVAIALTDDLLGVPAEWALMAVLISALMFIFQMRLTIWLAERKALSYAGLQVAYALLNAGLTVLLVIALSKGAEGRMSAQSWTAGIVALLALYSLHASRMLTNRVSVAYMAEAVRFGAPLVPHALGGIAIATFDRFVINKTLGLADTGLYMVAVQMALAIGLVADALNKAFVPWLYERLARQDPAFPLWMVKRTWLLFGVLLVLGLIGAAISPQVVVIIAGPKYSAAAKVLPWLIGGQVFATMYFLVANYIFYTNATRYLAVSSLLSGGLNVLLTLLLVPRLGIVGAGIAFCMAQGVLFGTVWWSSNRAYPMPWLFWRAARI